MEEDERRSKLNRQVKMLLALKFKRDDAIPAEIIPNLYIGSIGAALNESFLNENLFTHVLTVADNLPPAFPLRFMYKIIEIVDTMDFKIFDVFDQAVEFIDYALEDNGKILVHCFAGRSRSGAICCAYLIKKFKMTLEEALKTITQKRNCVMPNPGFLFQLQLYEKNFIVVDFNSAN